MKRCEIVKGRSEARTRRREGKSVKRSQERQERGEIDAYGKQESKREERTNIPNKDFIKEKKNAGVKQK